LHLHPPRAQPSPHLPYTTLFRSPVAGHLTAAQPLLCFTQPLPHFVNRCLELIQCTVVAAFGEKFPTTVRLVLHGIDGNGITQARPIGFSAVESGLFCCSRHDHFNASMKGFRLPYGSADRPQKRCPCTFDDDPPLRMPAC